MKETLGIKEDEEEDNHKEREKTTYVVLHPWPGTANTTNTSK